MIFGILPYVNFTKKENLDANSGISVLLCTGRLKINPEKPKKDGDESAVAMLKDARQLGLRISGHRAAGIFIDSTEEP